MDTFVSIQSVHEWQCLVEIARALGATPAHVSNSIDRGHTCNGCALEVRAIGAEEARMLGYDGRTKRVFRVARWSSEIDRLRQVKGRCEALAAEAERWIARLEALEAFQRARNPPFRII